MCQAIRSRVEDNVPMSWYKLGFSDLRMKLTCFKATTTWGNSYGMGRGAQP